MKPKPIHAISLAMLLLAFPWSLPDAQAAEDDAQPWSAATFKGLALRNIGPAFMSGRIAHIEIVPDDPATWYVAVGSGGVWKTDNAGTTWTPIFDDESSYSIGTLALDPNNAASIWVGTGENVGGRHVGFGDGVYHSSDGGVTWQQRGLAASEHISKIIVHPENPQIVWVAAQGPLWSKGGERGVYKTTDGGETWRQVLAGGPWTGATDLLIDPSNPDRLYAATWQHHRTVAAYIGGGPESGIHRSTDGGVTWIALKTGLPKDVNVGKIGLALSPQQPNVVYAAIELDNRTGGIWRSTDRGASWEKRSDMVSGGTGPHYYQELYASPHRFDQLYLMNNTTQVSEDGGKTWRAINNEYKHVDDHAIAFRPDDPDYLMIGSDGGLYESYDGERSWRFIANLPVTQFYKVAADDSEPFYQVYGGTQDNSSQGGPSRTDNRHGIRNSDWFITLFADGHQSATEPGNPDIMYAEWQEGNLARVDRTTGEVVHIQPQAKPGDPAERFNWDAPIYVSRHDPKRLYFASQRLWRSDDRGDSWQAISGDLTRDQNRERLPLMDRQWSLEAPWDLGAMSQYNTITSIGESPVDANVLYVGTDDGLIQSTRDGGKSWTRLEVGRLPGVPATAFVNDIRADLFDANTVYVALDNHKYGDYTPYLLKSTNGGRSFRSIRGDLPDRHLVWRVVQDHVQPNLLFTATEYGLFFTVDGGKQWLQLQGGAPTIAFRDVIIQRREQDLVAASFGRGIFILDDYTPLRELTPAAVNQNALLFPTRRAWWYIERHPLGFSEGASQGHGLYRAPNPPFGAVFTYYLKEGLQTQAEARQAAEKAAIDKGADTPFPGFDVAERERREAEPEIYLTVRDAGGTVVRRVQGPIGKGIHRVAWDLRFPSGAAIAVDPTRRPTEERPATGHLAAPGTYTVALYQRVNGVTTELASPQPFEVQRLRRGALPGAEPEAVVAFWSRLAETQRNISAASQVIEGLKSRLELMQQAIGRAHGSPAALDAADAQWHEVREALFAIEARLGGNTAQLEFGTAAPASIRSRLGRVLMGTGNSTYGPTATHEAQLGYAEADYRSVAAELARLQDERFPALEAALDAAGAPWTPGSRLPRARATQ
ncbi:MAG: glycosyl hydrolase [Pseudomonadota bacterium]